MSGAGFISSAPPQDSCHTGKTDTLLAVAQLGKPAWCTGYLGSVGAYGTPVPPGYPADADLGRPDAPAIAAKTMARMP